MKSLIVASTIVFASLSSTGEADTCADLIAAMPSMSKGIELVNSVTSESYKSLYDTCDNANTFAGEVLPKRKGSNTRLKCSSDPNNVSYVRKYPDGTVTFAAKGAVDADGSKYACGAGWPNQCGTWLEFDRGSTRHDVNAEDTPFIVVPRKMVSNGISFQKDGNIGKGDLAVVVWNGKCSYGVVGDAGPHFRLGELSLKAHAELGNPRCRKGNEYPCTRIIESGIANNVHYIVFPGTRPVPLTSQNVNSVSRQKAEEKLKAFIENYKQQ
jgi:hypothetical protein